MISPSSGSSDTEDKNGQSDFSDMFEPIPPEELGGHVMHTSDFEPISDNEQSDFSDQEELSSDDMFEPIPENEFPDYDLNNIFSLNENTIKGFVQKRENINPETPFFVDKAQDAGYLGINFNAVDLEIFRPGQLAYIVSNVPAEKLCTPYLVAHFLLSDNALVKGNFFGFFIQKETFNKFMSLPDDERQRVLSRTFAKYPQATQAIILRSVLDIGKEKGFC